jgi:hypothetical protein
MTNDQLWVRTRASALVTAAVFGVACSESYRSTVAQNPVPAVEAALVVSDSAPAVGTALVVSVRAMATQGAVASYTAKINYDPATLQFDGEVAMSDNALRASNAAAAGVVRIAGAAASGFTTGQLASYRFVVLSPNSVRTLSLVVDEMHMIDRVDAKMTLTVAPNRVTSR